MDAPRDGEGKEEKAPAVASWATDTSTIVTATTCSGTTIELYEGEKRMLDLHNRTRTEHGLSPLCVHPALTKAARDHSQDMIDKDYFAHASRDGSEPSDRMVRAGYAPCGRTYYCGENLAVGSSYPSTPDRLFEGLMNSSGHKANILKEEFREVGIGAHTGKYDEYDGNAWSILDRMIHDGDREPRRVAKEAELGLKQLWGKARGSSEGGAPHGSPETIALEARSEETKILYSRVLAYQSLVDGRLDPREIEYLYVFMSRIGLGPEAREAVRRTLSTEDVRPQDVVRVAEELVSEVPDSEDEISVSVIKDLMQVSRADGAVVPGEAKSVRAVAKARFGKRAEQVIQLAEKTVKYEEALIKGDVDVNELERHAKEIAAVATAASIPITALFFSGSVVGLSAAGITSGLAALGLGGVLGLSAMVTGIGTIVVVGVAAYTAMRYALGWKERELKKQRENMIQEVLKRHQGAIEGLAEDVNGIAMKLAEYVSKSDQNKARLKHLQGELQMFNAALAELKQEKEDLEDLSEQYAV